MARTKKIKRKRKLSPTARTLALCKRKGWIAEIVERWIPMARKRKDLFGFTDIVIVRDKKLILLQVTTGSNVHARMKKILESPLAPRVLEIPSIEIEVWGWREKKIKGSSTWEPRIFVLDKKTMQWQEL